MSALIEIAGMSIRTMHEYPPIPIRCWDWSAVDDNTYDGEGCRIGMGATEAEAVVDLILDSGEWPDRTDKEAAWLYRLRQLTGEPCAEADDAAPLADWVAP